MEFISDIQTSPKPSLLMKLVVTKGGDATYTDIKHDHMMNGVHLH
jgi:hypothetical protein